MTVRISSSSIWKFEKMIFSGFWKLKISFFCIFRKLENMNFRRLGKLGRWSYRKDRKGVLAIFPIAVESPSFHNVERCGNMIFQHLSALLKDVISPSVRTGLRPHTLHRNSKIDYNFNQSFVVVILLQNYFDIFYAKLHLKSN